MGSEKENPADRIARALEARELGKKLRPNARGWEEPKFPGALTREALNPEL